MKNVSIRSSQKKNLLCLMIMIATMPVGLQAQESAPAQTVYFQIFPNYFPVPEQPDRPTRGLNERTKIFSRLKLHPNQPQAANFVVRDETTEEGVSRQVVNERNGNEFLYSMSCRPETLRILEEKQQVHNEMRTLQRGVWEHQQSLSRIAGLNVAQRGELALSTIDQRIRVLSSALERARRGQNEQVTIIRDTDELSFFGHAVFGVKIPLPCVQVSNFRMIGCPNTPVQITMHHRDMDQIRSLARELATLNSAQTYARNEWSQALAIASQARSLADAVNARIAVLRSQITAREAQIRNLPTNHPDYTDTRRAWSRENDLTRRKIRSLETLIDVYNSAVSDQRASVRDMQNSITEIQARLRENEPRYTAANRECSETIKLIPIPVGAVLGAKAKTVRGSTGAAGDETFEGDNVRYFADSEVSFFHPYKNDVPVALTEVELVYMPPWLLSQEQMERLNPSADADNFVQLIDQRFSALYDIFRPRMSVSNAGGASLGNHRTRLFVESRMLNQNNEFPEQPVNPIEKRALVLDSYDKLARSMGAWGSLIKPPTEQVAMTSQTMTNQMVRNMVSRRDFRQQQYTTTSFSQKLSQLRGADNLEARLTTWGTPKWREIVGHEKNPHVKLMVEFALMRRQNRSVGMCFQYVKDAMLLSNLVTDRLTQQHAQQALRALLQEKWEADALNHPPLSYVRTETSAATVSDRLAMDFASINNQNKFRDIFGAEESMLKRYCKTVYASIGLDHSAPLVRAVCEHEGRVEPGAVAESRRLAEERASHGSRGAHPFLEWFSNPRIECLAPYGSIVIYRPLDGSPSGHIEIKTDEMGRCGFVSDHYHKKPLSERMPGRRQLMGVVMLNTR